MSRLRKNARHAKALLGETGEVRRVAALADVFQPLTVDGVWAVRALDSSGDGGIYDAYFEGPMAEERAVEYAEAKYSGVRRTTLTELSGNPG